MNAKSFFVELKSGSGFWNRFFLVNLSGILTWLASPNPQAVSTLAWVCMVPWLFAMTKASWKERLLWGLLYGLWYAIPGKWGSIWTAAYHLYPSFFQCFLVTGLFFFFYLVPFTLHSALPIHRYSSSSLRPLLHAAWFTVLFFLTPVVFPVNPANMLHDQTWIIQLADLGGIPIVLFLLFAVNAYGAAIFNLGFRHPSTIKHAMALLLLLSSTIAYGGWRIHDLHTQEETGHGTRVYPLAVQTQLSKYDTLSALIRHRESRPETAAEWTRHAFEKHPEADFAVWPELPLNFSPGNRERLIHERVSQLAVETGKPILYSCIETIADTTPALFYNSARLAVPGESALPAYHKRFFTPFYEHNPLSRWIDLGRFNMIPGSTEPIIELGRWKIIPAICYEIHFPQHIRQGVQMGGQVIVHMANFESFGDGPIAYYDFVMSKFRTVEFRLPMVKSCNRGYGAFVKATGELVEGSLNPTDRQNASCFSLWIPEKRSFYSAYGDLFLYGLTVWIGVYLFSRLSQSLDPPFFIPLSAVAGQSANTTPPIIRYTTRSASAN